MDSRSAQRLAERSVVIYDGLAGLGEEADLDKLRQELLVPSGKRVIGIVGQVAPEKGLREFVEAAKVVLDSFDDVHFLVIGEDPVPDRGFGTEMAGYAEHLGIAEHVTFAGFRRDAARCMSLMFASVLASWQDAFPRTVLESLARGVPVVATRVGGVPEQVEDGVSGFLVPTRDVQALAGGMMAMLRMSESDRSKMIDAAKRRAGTFSVEAHVESVQALYDELVG